MKKIIIAVSILLWTFSAQAQLDWSNNSYQTLKKGQKEVALFGPMKIGLKDSLELSAHPLLFFVIPHIELKKHWKALGSWELASKHKFVYPSLLYKLIAKRGVGGILPETAKIPTLFKFNNALLIGKPLTQNVDLTFNVGLDLTLALGDRDFPEIEYYPAYPRTYTFNHGIMPYVGGNLAGDLGNKFHYNYDLTAFFMMAGSKGMVWENKANLQWDAARFLALRAGAFYSYGQFPYGKDGRLLPTFDIVVRF